LKILFLGPDKCSQNRIINYLRDNGESVTRFIDRLDKLSIHYSDFNFLISYGYRFIIREDVLRCFDDKAINFHISYLPWNKGADPNLWSILENTPKGVSIHKLDKGLDTGDIICQRKVSISMDETLRSSYAKLETEMESLFIENWNAIKTNGLVPRKQNHKGTFHKSKDKESLIHLLTNGWDTKLSEINGKGVNGEN